MSTLFAGPWCGEFGWELFGWQAMLRQKSREHDRTVVACEQPSVPLYQDFADEIIAIPRHGDTRVGWKNYTPSLRAIATRRRLQRRARAEGGTYILNRTCFHYDEQEFIRFPSSSTPASGGPIAFIGRNIHKSRRWAPRSYHRNWPRHKWETLDSLLPPGPRVAVGLPGSALRLPQWKDERSTNLQHTIDVLTSASLIIGPACGTMHLAALTCTPSLMWVDPEGASGPEDFYRTDYDRIVEDWNPFDVPLTIIKSMDPLPEQVMEAFNDRVG